MISPPSSPEDNKDSNQNNRKPAVSLGLTMGVGVAFFSYLGFKVDERRGGGQIFTLIGIFLGLIYCAYEVWKVIQNNNPK